MANPVNQSYVGALYTAVVNTTTSLWNAVAQSVYGVGQSVFSTLPKQTTSAPLVHLTKDRVSGPVNRKPPTRKAFKVQ